MYQTNEDRCINYVPASGMRFEEIDQFPAEESKLPGERLGWTGMAKRYASESATERGCSRVKARPGRH